MYLNGESLVHLPLESRFTKLHSIINPNPTFVEILPMIKGHTITDLESNLDEIMDKGQEGLILKDPNSLYDPGSRENWYKVKPDYFDNLSESLDVLVVGAFYGEGRNAGKFASFMCAVRDTSKDYPTFQTICKVGSGFSTLDLEEMNSNANSSEIWTLCDGKNWPLWLDFRAKKKPDRILKNSEFGRVITIRASQACMSHSGERLEIKFPRFVEFRNDKNASEITTLSELTLMTLKNQGRMFQSNATSSQSTKPNVKKPRIMSRRVPSHYQGSSSTCITALDDLFNGKQVCILIDRNHIVHERKKELEEMILKHGGTITQNPIENKTDWIVSDANTTTVIALVKKKSFDIVKSCYIQDCINEKKLVKLHPKRYSRVDFIIKINEIDIWSLENQLQWN